MAERGLHLGELVADVDWAKHVENLSRWRQGHLVENIPVSWMAPAGVDPMTGQDHEQGKVAPLVHGSLLDNGLRKLAGNWQVGYLVSVNSPFLSHAPVEEPAAGEGQPRRRQPLHEWFADLRLITPVSKALLLDREPIQGFNSEELYQIFAETLGYKLRRPALHNALSEAIPGALNEWVKKQGKTKTYIANVEHVRVLILDGTALAPTRAEVLRHLERY